MTIKAKKNILLTGATGFIGSHVLHRLLSLKYNITILKRKTSNTWRIRDILDKVIVCNIDKTNNYEKIIKEQLVDGIVHVATKYIKNNASQDQIEEMVKSNVLFPSLLLEAAIGQNVKFFINTGTFSEYKTVKKPVRETSVIDPVNYYSATKSVFENILRFYSQQKKIKGVTLKLFSPYGEKDNQKIIPLIIRSFVGGEILATTKGEQKLSFTYVDDTVDAYIKAIGFAESNNFHYDSFNIGSDRVYSIIEIIKTIEKISKKKSKIEIGAIPYDEKEIMYMCCDNTKAKKILNWNPKTDISEGLSRTYNFYKKYYATGSEH